MAAVDKGESIQTAAIKFNALHSPLHNRVTGKVKVGARERHGPPSCLMIEEELAIFVWAMHIFFLKSYL